MQIDSPFQNYKFVLVKKWPIDFWAIYDDITYRNSFYSLGCTLLQYMIVCFRYVIIFSRLLFINSSTCSRGCYCINKCRSKTHEQTSEVFSHWTSWYNLKVRLYINSDNTENILNNKCRNCSPWKEEKKQI